MEVRSFSLIQGMAEVGDFETSCSFGNDFEYNVNLRKLCSIFKAGNINLDGGRATQNSNIFLKPHNEAGTIGSKD